MNANNFDALTRRLAASKETRRNLFKMLGFGAIGMAAVEATSAFAAPQSPTPGRVRRNQSDTATLIDELAFDLEYDRDLIIDFVANDIRFEPYVGALRGAMGTLWAGSGNAADKSQLLVALLQASEISATISTTEAVPGDLTTLWQAQQSKPFSARVANAILTFSGVDAPTAQGTPVPSADTARNDIQQKAQARISSTITQLSGAIQSAGVDITKGAGTSVSTGVWHSVLVDFGTDQVAVDVVTGQKRQSTAAPPVATPVGGGEMADDEFHIVTIRVVTELVSGTSTQMTTILETPLRSQDMVGKSIALVHMDGGDMNAIGLDLGDILGGTVAYTPLLIAGEDFFYGTSPMIFGGQGGVLDALNPGGAGGATDGEPVAEYVEIEIHSPGFEPKLVSRTIFDRLADQRASDTFDFSKLTPVEVINLGDDFKRYLPVASLIAFAVLPGALPPGYTLLPDPSQTPVQNFANAAKGVQSVRQQLLLAAATSGSSGYIDRPNVISYSYAPSGTAATSFDMVKISADVVFGRSTGVSGDDSVPYGMLAGVAMQVAERTALDPDMFALVDSSQPGFHLPQSDPVSVGAIFDAANTGNVELLVLKSAEDIAKLPADLPASAIAIVKGHIDANEIVITPSALVTIGNSDRTGWWVFNPATGDWYDELQDGTGGYMYETLGGYALLLRNVIVARAPYLLLAECIAAIASAANDLMTSSYWSALAGAVANYNVCK